MKNADFQGIVAGLEDAIAFVKDDTSRGRVAAGQPPPTKAEAQAIRARTGLGQAES